MEKEIPLVVPEINANILKKEHKIIANPNCSTIQMVMALAPIHRKYGIKRVVVATYQSVTGSGNKGRRQLENEREGKDRERAYPHKIDLNLIPRAGSFTGSGYTTEEEKLVYETRKILADDSIRVTATAVRVPVTGGHSEAVNLELSKPFNVEDVRSLLAETRGIIVQDDPGKDIYPMPAMACDKDEVFVGRIRRDDSVENGLNLWIVSDNLRKGAATNAVDIAVYLQENNLIGEVL
jgi:aspartate-semialdehyde dehydrogenase